jgi:hypothetical protein
VEGTKEHVRHFNVKISNDDTDFEYSTEVLAYRGTTPPKFMSAPGELFHSPRTRTTYKPIIRINRVSAWIRHDLPY